MTQTALTVPFTTFDLQQALLPWSWLRPDGYAPLELTAFGDWILQAPDGTIHFLDAVEGRISRIAESRESFERLKGTEEKRDEWYLEGLLLGLERRGVRLRPGQCFGFEIHPTLGGAVEPRNLRPFEVVLYQTFVGKIHEQSRRPPGGGPPGGQSA